MTVWMRASDATGAAPVGIPTEVWDLALGYLTIQVTEETESLPPGTIPEIWA